MTEISFPNFGSCPRNGSTHAFWTNSPDPNGNSNYVWELCIPASGEITDACDPTYYTADPVFEDLTIGDPKTIHTSDKRLLLKPGTANRGCIEKCMVGYMNDDKERAAAVRDITADEDTFDAIQNVRMFHHADVNRDGSVNLFDIAAIKEFFEKGFGPAYNPGFDSVDYNKDGWASPAELENAELEGKAACGKSEPCNTCTSNPVPGEDPCLSN